MERTKVQRVSTKPEHLAFVRILIANGFNATEAYKEVYPKSKTSPSGCASRLLARPAVSALIAQQQRIAAEKANYTIETAQQEYEEARLLAIKANQPAAAVSAITGKARLFGYDKDNNLKDQTVIIINPPGLVDASKQVDSAVVDSLPPGVEEGNSVEAPPPGVEEAETSPTAQPQRNRSATEAGEPDCSEEAEPPTNQPVGTSEQQRIEEALGPELSETESPI